VPQVKNPVNYTNARMDYERAPPLLGQHSDEILREIGVSDAEIATLRSSGVI
jgi:crotonobetainyl-CoA:carnitine CoA-transferase CaiB-like acyl-CoA transferase